MVTRMDGARKMRALDVGVVGAGTAGSAAAIFLRRAGHQVTIYERVPDPSPVGAGIVLQPTGVTVLKRLGLDEAVVSRGARLDRLRCLTSRGRQVVDLPYRLLGEGLHGHGMHRGVIFETLYHAARDAGAAVLSGRGVRELQARSADRLGIVDDHGVRRGNHDLVIVADGARSQLRGDTDPEIKKSVRPYRWGALWFVGHDSQHRFVGELHQIVEGTRRMMGLLPTGLGPRGDVPLVSLFWSLRADRLDEWRRTGLGHWKSELLRYAPEAESLVAQITHPDQVLFSQYHDVVMDRWHTRNVVYLGDAAHAMSPQLGQGCNLALYDAMVLADTVAAHSDLPTALADYTRRRRRHLGIYQLATRWLTPFFQSDLPLALARDLGLGLLGRIPWIRRRMVASMCGYLLGPFASLDP